MRYTTFLFVFVFLHFFHIVISQQNFTYYQCTDIYGTYTRNSKFQSNLLKVLYTISSDTQIDYGFYNFSAGDTPNQVNAIALCRGDLTKAECSKCRNDAIIKLTRLCPKEKEAVGWYSNCTLWYSPRTIFGISEEGNRFEIYNTASLEPTPVQFSAALTRLLNYINKNASLGDSRLKFATGETSFTTNKGYIYKIFALSQCNPDLTEKLCSNCLSYLTNLHLKCCGNETMSWFASPSCNVRYEPDRFYNILGTPSILPPTPAPTISEDIYAPSYAPTGSLRTPHEHSNTSGKKSNKSKTIVLIAVISTVASLALVVLCYASFRMRKMKRISEETKVEIASVESLQYDFSTIKAATDNFCLANKLGHGGFGVVYKGIIPDGREIAVKRLASNNSGQGEAEFKNEIALLAELQHRNLVRLYGFCLDKKERILVYEFVPNASLDHFLFESPEEGGLDWSKRRQIIGGIAQGLVYLHEHSRLKIIHRDLKPANILLDAEMNPKIADFGLAKLFPANETHENASKVAGTYGYMAPEYTRYMQFSVKSDVYSFGILLLEIICGRRNSGFFEEEFAAGLVSLVWKNWREGTILNVVDPKVALSISLETEVCRHIHIGLLCVQKNVADRPNMSSVIIWLSTDFSLPLPSFPGYISETFQLPYQASDSDWSTLNSNMSSMMNENSGSLIHPFRKPL